MDSALFDAVTRRLAATKSRRLALRAGAAGLAALLADATLGSEAEGARKTNKQKRNDRQQKERRRERKKERRQDRKDKCAANEKKCGDTCISVDRCCTNNECTGSQAGQCANNTCQAAFQTCENEDGTVSFVAAAPGNPPKSKGAVKFTVGPADATLDWAHLRSSGYAGLPITAIKKLEFGTYSELLNTQACPDFLPYMALYTVEGNNPQILVSSAPLPSPGQCNTWQVVDAATEKWWMPLDSGFAGQQSPKTLEEIAVKYPNMVIRNAVTTDTQCPTALGGLRLEYGEFPGGGGTGDAVAYVSYLDVEIGNRKETFLF